MAKSLDQLILTLNKEVEVYKEVLSNAKLKRQAIRDEDIKTLDEATKIEQGLVVTLFKLEEIRGKLLEKLVHEYKIDFVENISQLMEFVSKKDRERIMMAKNQLTVLIKNVTDENRFNARLLEERLKIISLNIELLTKVSDDSGKYNKDAVNDDYERKNIFDARV